MSLRAMTVSEFVFGILLMSLSNRGDYDNSGVGAVGHTQSNALAKSWTNALRSLCGQRHDYPFSCVISVIKVKSSEARWGANTPKPRSANGAIMPQENNGKQIEMYKMRHWQL